MLPRFGKPVTVLSRICSEVTEFIYNNHGRIFNDMQMQFMTKEPRWTIVLGLLMELLWLSAVDLYTKALSITPTSE